MKHESKGPGRPKGVPRSAAEIEADRFRTGRPKKDIKAQKTALVALRLTDNEYNKFILEANKLNLSAAAFAKHCWLYFMENKNGVCLPRAKAQEKPGFRENGEGI